MKIAGWYGLIFLMLNILGSYNRWWIKVDKEGNCNIIANTNYYIHKSNIEIIVRNNNSNWTKP